MQVVIWGPTPVTSGFVTTTFQSSSTRSMIGGTIWAVTVASETVAIAVRVAARTLGMRIGFSFGLVDARNSAGEVESDQAPLGPRLGLRRVGDGGRLVDQARLDD